MNNKIKDFLESIEVEYTLYKHKAVFSVEEAKIICKGIPGIECKNLFLKDRKGSEYFLIVMPGDKRLQIDNIAEKLSIKKMKFANENELKSILGVSPGSVSIFCLLNDKEKKVNLIIDEEILEAKEVNCHPNDNTQTVVFSHNNFLKIVNSLRTKYVFL